MRIHCEKSGIIEAAELAPEIEVPTWQFELP